MPNRRLPQREEPQREGLPIAILKFLVFLTFAFVLFEAMVGLGERDLSAGRAWVAVAGMMGLLLLLGIDRLTALRFTTSGVEATLAESKNQALDEVGELDDQQVAAAARAQILEARSPDQVEGTLALAIELNVHRVLARVKEAIEKKRKACVRYRPDPRAPVETYQVACLDVKAGKTQATEASDYLWAYSYDHERIISLRLGRVVGMELCEEGFNPAELMAVWKREPEWNLPREW